MSQLEVRTCAEKNCTVTFKCMPTSPQTGCCRFHDKRGKLVHRTLVMRRKKIEIKEPQGV